MATTRAAKKPINQPVVFFDNLADLRRANGQDPELAYIEAYECPLRDGYIIDSVHAYRGHDGRLYHNDQCAEIYYREQEYAE